MGATGKAARNEPEGARCRMTLDATILQVIPALDAGGAERTTVEVAAAVVRAGGKAVVATSGGRLCDEVRAVGGDVILGPVQSKNPLMILRNAGWLANVIADADAAIIHARSRAPAWSAGLAARRTGAAFVTTYHGAYGASSPLKRWYNSSMVRGDVVIANSEYTADAIRATYGLAQDRLRIIPRGADLSRFDPTAVSDQRLRALARAWRIPEMRNDDPNRPLIVLLPARMTPWKGHATAIEALAQLIPRNGHGDSGQPVSKAGAARGFRLIFCGDAQGRDDYVAALCEAAWEAGVGDMVTIVGHCADMPAAYLLADLVLQPSERPEAFGRVAVEAGAMGCPVIASDHGGARETVRHGQTGYLTPAGDASALAEAIASVAAMSNEQRREVGAAAHTWVAEHFSTTAMIAATIAAYEDALAIRSARRR